MEAIPQNVLIANENQKGNPILRYVKNVRFVFSDQIKPDYVINSTCVVFTTVTNHVQHPQRLIRQFEIVGSMYRVRILLVEVNSENNLEIMQEFNRLAFIYNFTAIFAFSQTECGRYLETFKSYEAKAPSSIQAKEETEFLPRLHKLLANNIRSVNKTDVATLLDVFHNFANVCSAKQEELILCPGIGETKAKRIYAVLHEPFMKDNLFSNKKGVGTTMLNVSINSEDIYKNDGVELPPAMANEEKKTVLEKRSAATDVEGNDTECIKEKKLKSVEFSANEEVLPPSGLSKPSAGVFGKQVISTKNSKNDKSSPNMENAIEIDV